MNPTKAGTAGGTLTVLLANINHQELLKTALLALIGSIVSFSVTAIMKYLLSKREK